MRLASNASSEPQACGPARPLRPSADQLQRLGAFDGDSRAAWRLHSEVMREIFGDVAMALVLRSTSGPPRLVALTDTGGVVRIEASDSFDRAGAALALVDPPTREWLRTTEPKRVETTVCSESSVLRRLLGTSVICCLPLHVRGRQEHCLLLGSAAAHALASVEVGDLWILSNLFAANLVAAIDRRQMVEETRKAQVEIQDLADVQRRLLPDNPQIRGLAHAVHYQPSAMAGGDYYDLMSLSHLIQADYPAHWPDAFGTMIADVSGHGAGAAMEAVQFDAILRTYSGGEAAGPADALTYANKHFFSRRSRPHFMTVISVLHLPQENLARICNAGHLPPLLRRDGQVRRLLQGRDIPIGVLREHVYTDERLETRAGDLLVMYTDGITEARDSQGREFGIERLESILAQTTLTTPEAIRTQMLDALFAHQGGEIGQDDQTLLIVRLAGPSGARSGADLAELPA